MATPAKVIVLPVKHRSTRAFLSPAELLAVLKVARARSTRDWAMVLMCYRHGMRASEICGLKRPDVNVKEQWVRIERLKGSLTTVQPLAGHKGRPILDELAALKAYLRVRRPDWVGFRFRERQGRAFVQERVLQIVFRHCRCCRAPTRQVRAPYAETFNRESPDRRQHKHSDRQSGRRTQEFEQHDGIHSHQRCTGFGSRRHRHDENLLNSSIR